jgi:hypothetical protein
MNSAQTNLYFYEWGKVRKHYLDRGIDPKQADSKRHMLHRKALGRDKSSKDFTNGDLDAVLATFKGVYDGANLDAQIAQLDQPESRLMSLHEQCLDAAGDMHQLGDARLREFEARLGYIRGTAKAVARKEPGECSEAELGKVLGCLRRRVAVMKKKNPAAAAAVAQPF